MIEILALDEPPELRKSHQRETPVMSGLNYGLIQDDQWKLAITLAFYWRYPTSNSGCIDSTIALSLLVQRWLQ